MVLGHVLEEEVLIEAVLVHPAVIETASRAQIPCFATERIFYMVLGHVLEEEALIEAALVDPAEIEGVSRVQTPCLAARRTGSSNHRGLC